MICIVLSGIVGNCHKKYFFLHLIGSSEHATINDPTAAPHIHGFFVLFYSSFFHIIRCPTKFGLLSMSMLSCRPPQSTTRVINFLLAFITTEIRRVRDRSLLRVVSPRNDEICKSMKYIHYMCNTVKRSLTNHIGHGQPPKKVSFVFRANHC